MLFHVRENLLDDNLREQYFAERMRSEFENSRDERIQELERQVKNIY
jgi:hypothetical protein